MGDVAAGCARAPPPDRLTITTARSRARRMASSIAVVGTAGWSVPRAFAPRLALPGTHLARYASMFSGTEINSSFWRSHAARTYERWAAATPAAFRFAVKVPRTLTHEQ